MPCLHNILRNENINRSVKLPAFHALGDLSLNSGDNFNKVYLQDTLNILDMAAQMTVQVDLSTVNDSEYLEFLQELRDEIICQYSTILISIGDSDDARMKKSYQQHLHVICEFISKSIERSGPNDVNLLKQAAGLVMDLAQLFSDNSQLKQALMQPSIESLLNALHQYPDEESKQTATAAYESISNMCAS